MILSTIGDSKTKRGLHNAYSRGFGFRTEAVASGAAGCLGVHSTCPHWGLTLTGVGVALAFQLGRRFLALLAADGLAAYQTGIPWSLRLIVIYSILYSKSFGNDKNKS